MSSGVRLASLGKEWDMNNCTSILEHPSFPPQNLIRIMHFILQDDVFKRFFKVHFPLKSLDYNYSAGSGPLGSPLHKAEGVRIYAFP